MKKLKTLCLLITLSFIPKLSFGQLVYTELGGAGVIYSVNYDTRISPKTKFGFRVGLGLLPVDGVFAFLPVQLNYAPSGKHGIEIGAGVTGVNSIGQLINGRQFSGLDDADIYQTITLVYRIQSTKLYKFRVGFTALINADFEFPWNAFWPTLSIGRQF